jgi:DMSO/TMAO reductase YedYZ heme-binding membrane subunit
MKINKLLLAQAILLLFILALCFYLGIYYSVNYSFFTNLLEIVTFSIILIVSFVFAPLLYVNYRKIKKGENVNNINKTYTIIIWSIIFTTVILVFLSIINIFYSYLPELGFWGSIKYSFGSHFSYLYLVDRNYGFWPDMIEVFKTLLYLLISVTLFLILKTNQAIKENN